MTGNKLWMVSARPKSIQSKVIARTSARRI